MPDSSNQSIDRYLDDLSITVKSEDGTEIQKCFTDADGLSRIEFLRLCSIDDKKCIINHLFALLIEIYEHLPDDDENKNLYLDMLANFVKLNGDFFNIIKNPITDKG